MTTIEAGPYEFVKHELNNFIKQTLCLMDDNSISQRQYNQYGNILKETFTDQNDLVAALASIERIIRDLKSQNYIEQQVPIS